MSYKVKSLNLKVLKIMGFTVCRQGSSRHSTVINDEASLA